MLDPAHLATSLGDRYVIDREIGSGGMAVVYLARDRKLERDVALKVLRPELGAVLGADRFLAEIKISARLDHPHILTLIDSGDADGLLYYVLPYVRGETLREKLNRERQLGIDEAIAITKEVAGALDYAHRQGLVHRDIKPENILLQEGEAMLTDFGIALAVKEAGGNRLTQTGLSLGTPQYMSPEQATGDRSLDARSDVYSLAAVLYEMLVGEPPVTGANAQVMIAKLMTEKPTRVRLLRDTVSAGVDEAIVRALSKTPADRFASAEEFVRALDRDVTQTAETAASGSRRRMVVLGATVIVAVALGGAAFAMWGRGAAPVTHVTLGQKTQLTSSGEVISPAVSPDGKQLAYAVRRCTDAGCSYSLIEQDVGGSASRSILDGAAGLGELEWSPDRRNIIFYGAAEGHYGTFVISALGGPPRWLGLGVAAFYAGGDSLLLGPRSQPDSAYWVRVAGLDGIAHDSILVHGKGTTLGALSAIPGTKWILTMIQQGSRGLWQVIDRSGKVADQVVNSCTCGGIGTVDAVWLMRAADAGTHALVRIPIDPATGHLAAQQDTMTIARVSNISVTSDGASVMFDEGTTEYDTWAVSFTDFLKGDLLDERRVVHASNFAQADVSPDGARLLYHRIEATPDGQSVERHTVGPFAGGSESPLPYSAEKAGVYWYDSVTVIVRHKNEDGGRHFGLLDIRSGRERNTLDVPDSTLRDAAPLPDGWVWGDAGGRHLVVDRGGERREIPVSDWYAGAGQLAVTDDGKRVFFSGWDRRSEDTLAVDAVDLSDGTSTRWVTMPSLGGDIQLLADGSLYLNHYMKGGSAEIYRVTAPGKMQLLGHTPRPELSFQVSKDLKWATVSERQNHADAWLYKVQSH